MKKLLKSLDDNLEEWILLVLLAVISCVTMLQVIMRYVFQNALSWPEELCRYCFVYSGMLSIGYCIKRKKNLQVDVLYNFFPKALQILIQYAGKLLMIGIYGYIAYSSIGLIQNASTFSTAMQIPMKYVYLSLPIGTVLGVIGGIQDLVAYTKEVFGREKGKC